MSKDNDQTATPISPSQYDEAWIKETWGWDDPEEFVRSGGFHIRPRVVRALEFARLNRGLKVLDVGCGRGEVVLYCARSGIEAVGIDYSSEAIDLALRARDNLPADARARSRFVLGDVNSLEESEGLFDRILLLDLVEHLHDSELIPLLVRLRKHLKPEGFMVIHTLPNRWIYEITYARLLRTAMPWLDRNPRPEKERAIHINEMSITHLDQLLRHCGYECRLGLREMITAQARWHSRSPLQGVRGKIYRLSSNPVLSFLYRIMSMTPLRLLIVNDIYCVANERGGKADLPNPGGATETITCYLGRRFAPWSFGAADGRPALSGKTGE